MFSDPKSNLSQLGLQKGMKVADLGVGAGFYALEAARLVGDQGLVFAIDVQKELVAALKRTAEKEGLSNVETIWGDVEKPGGTKIKDGVADAAIISNILFQIENKESFVEEVSRILRLGGKVVVIDWKDSFAGIGPSKDHVYAESEAEKLFSEKGFKIEKKFDAGSHHYGFVALKS